MEPDAMGGAAPGEIFALRLARTAEPCPYIAGLRASFEQYLFLQYEPEAFCRVVEEGFRHFGSMFFRPDCAQASAAGRCGACVPVRVPVKEFTPSKSQRRVLRKGAEVEVTLGRPCYTAEKFEIYLKHKERFPPLGERGEESDAPIPAETFQRLFYEETPVTRECTYTLGGRLVGAGLIDIAPRVLSSIYFFFDPVFSELSPGTLSILYELSLARTLGIPYYYLGYMIHQNAGMRYKMDFRPCEYYDGTRWHRLREGKTFLEDPAAVRTGPFKPLLAQEWEWGRDWERE